MFRNAVEKYRDWLDERYGGREKVKEEEAKSEGERDVAMLEELREKVRIVEIQSAANLPEVRWKARNGMGELVVFLFH